MRKERHNGAYFIRMPSSSDSGEIYGDIKKVLRELADVLEGERKRRRLTNVKESRQFVRRWSRKGDKTDVSAR